MKAFPLVLLNLAAVVVGIVAYDVFRSEPEPPDAVADGADAAAELADRLADLEADRRRSRRGGAVEASILDRLAALEAASGAPAPIPEPRAAEADAAPPAESVHAAPDDGEPTAEEIARFRSLQEAVRREDTVRKLAERVDKQLAGLPLSLSDEQRERVHGAFADFRPRINEIWGEAKAAAQETVAAGGQVDRATIVADTTALIQQEFATTLDGIVASGDAEMIAAALLSGGK